MSAPSPTAELRREVAELAWYHTLELAPGLTTPGWLDHRSVLPQVPLPASLRGKRCLDVGTFNGFWAFELERRGAAEVVAIDVLDPLRWDWPATTTPDAVRSLAGRMAGGRGFEIARELLGARVERIDRSVLELDPAEIGTFDLVFVGSLLVHLRDPVLALERVRSVCSGTLVLMDGIDLALTLRRPRTPVANFDGRGRPWWWYPNLAALARMAQSGGFTLAGRPRLVFVPPGAGWNPPRFDRSLLRGREGRHALVSAWRGDPHAVVVAQPTPGYHRAA